MPQWGTSGSLWGGGVAEAVYPAYHVILGGVGLVFGPGGYERRLQQAFAAKLSTSQLSQADRLADQAVLLDGWQGGEGYLRHDPDNPDRYRFGGGIDVYSEPGAVGLGPRMVNQWASSLNGLTKLCATRTELFIGTSDGKIYTWTGSGTPSLDLNWGKAGGVTALCRAFSDETYAGNGTDAGIYRHTASGGWASLFTLSGSGVTSCHAMSPQWKDGTQYLYIGADKSGGRATIHYTDGSTDYHYSAAVLDEPRIDLMIRKRDNLVIVGTDHTHYRTGLYVIDGNGAANSGFDQRLAIEGSVLQCGAVIGDNLYLGDKYGGRLWVWNGTDLFLAHRFGSEQNPYSAEIRGLWAYGGSLWVSIVDEDGSIGLARLDPDSGAWSRPVTGLSGTTPEDLSEFQGKLVALTSATGASKLYSTDGTYTSTGNVESSLIDARLAGTDKILRGVTVNHSELAATQSVAVQYQLEDDGTWVTLGTSDTDGATTALFDFPSAITADLFALKLILTGTAGSSTPLKVYSVNLRYYPAPGAKREWSLRLQLLGGESQKMPLVDGTTETRTGEELSAEVWALVATGAPVNLVDIDREEYTVQIAEYREGLAGQSVQAAAADQGWELEGSMRLVEV
jgi:hypothetical protein